MPRRSGSTNTWPQNTPGIRPNRAGAHTAHVNVINSYGTAQNLTCSYCHPAPGSPRSGTGEGAHDDIVDPADLHQDGRTGAATSYFKTLTGADDTDATYDSATETCSAVDCHGGNTAPNWYSGTPNCTDCHTGTEGGALSDGIPNAVDDEWASDGHGSAAGGSFGSALGGCDYCHQLDSGHLPTAGTNPYRLRYTPTDNSLCMQCHLTGDVGLVANSAGTGLNAENGSLNVDTAHFGTKHSVEEGGANCWDCHDPHGVPVNTLMVKSNVSQAADTYGIPTTTVPVTFTQSYGLPPPSGPLIKMFP